MKTSVLFVAGILMMSCNNTQNTADTKVSAQNQKVDSNANLTPTNLQQPTQAIITNAPSNQVTLPAKTSSNNTINNTISNDVTNQNNQVNSSLTPNILREQFNTVVVKERYAIPISNTPTTISTKKGSTITINTSDLVTANGKALTAPVEVKVMEMKNSFDMLAMHSPTVSDNQILESGGSWYIDATSNGEAVKLKEGKSYRLESAIEVKPGFSLFYGEKKSDGTINWKPTNASFIKSSNTTNPKVDVLTGIRNTAKANGLKINRGCFTPLCCDGSPYNYFENETDFSYWVDKNGINQICSEIWILNKNALSRKKIMDGGFRMEDIIKNISYSEFNDEQKRYLFDILQNAECIDRTRVFDKNSKSPINYEFIIERNNNFSQFVIDSVVITNSCNTLPVEIKKLIENKIDKYCKANYNNI